MDLGSRIGPRVDRSLLEGIYSPEKVGSQAITLAGNGVRADTQLVVLGPLRPDVPTMVCSAESPPPAGAGYCHATFPPLLLLAPFLVDLVGLFLN